jgi:uncharacterized protein YhaN
MELQTQGVPGGILEVGSQHEHEWDVKRVNHTCEGKTKVSSHCGKVVFFFFVVLKM